LSTLPNIISRGEARALGLKRYFTGKPCRHGHVAERGVNGGECVDCNRENNRKYRADPERARKRAAAREKERERSRLYYAKNKDKLLSQRAAKRAADPESAREYQRMWRAANKDEINRRRVAQYRAARAASELNGAGLTGASEGNT
jgi:hypothetical protein